MEELSYALIKDFVSCVHEKGQLRKGHERDSCVADIINFLTGNITFSEIENEKRTWYLVYFRSPREGLGYGEIGGWLWGGGGVE